jgi:hypothetical protein
MRPSLALLLLCLPAACAEKAAYDSNGRITALLSDSGAIGVTSNLVAVLPGGKRVPLMTRRDDPRATRQGLDLVWSLAFTLPDGGRGRATLKSEEDPTGLRYTASVTAESALELDAIEFVIDLPHAQFVKGALSADAAPPIPLALVRAAGPVLFHGDASTLRAAGPADLALDLTFAPRAGVSVIDRWDAAGRSYQLRAAVARGPMQSGAAAALATALRLTNHAPAPTPARLTLDTARTRYLFDGFGANYCWNNQSPISAYTMANLKLAWARVELKAQQWDKQRANPGAELRADFETMRRLQQKKVPFVISIWWLPERFYTDPYEKPRSAHLRTIDPARWDDLLDLIGSYLVYAKREYSAEPALFSFNEANIGIYVGLTPQSHTEAIKRIGAHFQNLGLKTKMLLGDATGPRDTHKFALDAAADPEALQYVGAVGFHSWGGGTAEQYTAWGDLAEWLHLPLLVTELGVDADAYHNRAYDSFQYGLEEARMTQELLLWARPQGTQYWQFTNDYALVRSDREGKIEPTARFWIMKHFTDLTPPHSEVLSADSSDAALLVTAFRAQGRYTIHILNTGAARPADLAGLPDAAWQITETTESAQYKQRRTPLAANHILRIDLPARSLVTLTSAEAAPLH